MNVDFIIGSQWGSEGKGKLAGYLAQRIEYEAVMCEYGPNTGHTYQENGNKFVFKSLPVASLFLPEVFMSPECVIDLEALRKEFAMVRAYRANGSTQFPKIHIHPLASVVTEEARKFEQLHLQRISSTLKGAGAARALKSMRVESVMLAHQCPELQPLVDRDYESHLWSHQGPVLAETSQGFDLSLNWGVSYPYVTGRDITLASVVNSFGISFEDVANVYGCLRTFPIRVGNTNYSDVNGPQFGWSGPVYPDQEELSWEQIGFTPETTTVTGKIRRVFTFSPSQIARFIRLCSPTGLFLNFVNYLPGQTSKTEVSKDTEEWMATALRNVHTQLRALDPNFDFESFPEFELAGTAADNEYMVQL